jgi:hypothetical protein
MKVRNRGILMFTLLTNISWIAYAQEKPTSESPQEIANKLSNPVANMISVPFQNNVDYGIGRYNGSKYTLNFQPVIPIKLNSKINLITRYIIPIIDQHDVAGDGTHQFGLSDATVSAFFSPIKSKNGVIWGAGPAFLFPIGTNDFLSTRQWGMGPTALVLKQEAGFTYGFLANEIWSFAGDRTRPNVNQLFLQPFFAHNWKSGGGLSANMEITFNWQANTTIAFLNPLITGVTKLGKQAVSLAVGPRIPLGGPAESTPDFGIRGVMTFVFPK